MRLSIKHFLALWILLLLAVGALLFNAYGKLKPEVLISLLSEQVQRNYPGAKLEVGKVDYRLSVNFNMGLKDIVLRRNGKIIGSLEEFEIRLPWWLLLFERGNAQIHLRNLDVFIDEDEDETAPTSGTPNVHSTSPQRIKLSVPDYLAKAHFTLRVKDVTIKNLASDRRYFTLNKLLLKEFQFGKNSAFELNLPINISHNDTNFNSELWLFGDLTPERDEWSLKFRGEFRTTETGEKFQLEDLIIDGKAKIKPHELDVASALSFFIEKKEVGTGEFQANDKELAISLKFSELPLSFLALFEDEIKNPYLPLIAERAAGTVEIKKRYRNEVVKLDGFLEFPGHFPLGQTPETQVPGKWRLNFNGSKWETSFMSPKGDVSFFRRSAIDFKKGVVAQYVEELGFTEIDLSTAIGLVLPLDKFIEPATGPYSSTTVSFKKCRKGEKVVNGVFRYGVSPGQKFYVGELTEDDKILKINFESTSAQKKLNLEVLSFPWWDQYKFLEKFFSADTAVLDGKLEGRWNEEWKQGQWLSKLKGTMLKNPKGEWFNFVDKFWRTFNIDSVQIPGQQWNLSLKSGLFVLDSLLLDGSDPGKLTGQIDLNMKKKSYLVLNYPKNRKWKPVKKELSGPFLQRTEND